VGLVGGKGRPSVGKVGEWYVESRHIKGYCLRLCRLRTDGLAVTPQNSEFWNVTKIY
jgi:hypothetical protein